jgi:chromosome segregation ATPase
MQVAADFTAMSSAAIALMTGRALRKQQDGANQPLDQSVSDTSQFQAQLVASEERRQRLQQKYEALSTSHDVLTGRCSQLEQQLQASQAAERTSSAKAAAANRQLEVMRQQLKDANRFLDQQQKINNQQAAQLQKAVSSLEGGKWKAGNTMAAAAATQQQLQQALGAKDREVRALSEQLAQLSAAFRDNKKIVVAAEAEGAATKQHLAALQQQHEQLQAKYACIKTESAAAAQHFQTEQQQVKQQLADMAAAVTAADAATRRVQRDEAALLQAMAHLAQQHAEGRQQLPVVREQLKAAEAEVNKQKGLVAFLDHGMNQEREHLLGLVRAAESRLASAETQALTYKVAVKRMRDAWDECIDELEADCDKLKAELKQQLMEVVEQAAADKAELEGQVALLRSRLQLVNDVGSGAAATPSPVDAIKPQEAKRRGMGLKLLWQSIRWVCCFSALVVERARCHM